MDRLVHKRGAKMSVEKVCIVCGKTYSVKPSRVQSKYCSQKCSIEHQRGENAYTWQGGKTLNPDYSKEWQRKNRNKGLYTKYTKEEEALLVTLIEAGKSLEEIAQKLNRSNQGVQGKIQRMGLGFKKKWTQKDLNLLVEMHKNGASIKEIASELKTTEGSIEAQISKHGIGSRPGSKEFSEKASRRNKKLWNDPEHAFNQPEYREKLSACWKDPNSPFNSDKYRQALSDNAYKNKPGLKSKNSSGNVRYKGGTREDLGHYVRSRWEANIARYLKFLIEKGEIKKYEYEPDCFEFIKIKRGNRSYTPDFKVYLNNGKVEYWEVKGYMDKESRVKLNRMEKYYPETKIILIEKEQYKEIGKWSRLIANWE